MRELLLIVTIADRCVAMRASDIHSVIELDGLTPVPLSAPHVAGLAALRSRVLTVIDCRRSLELEPMDQPMGQAAVVEHEGHFYALAFDQVVDVTERWSEPEPIRAALGCGWQRVSLGMAETAEGPLLLIDAAALIVGPAVALAA